jgi:hypothetical protein
MPSNRQNKKRTNKNKQTKEYKGKETVLSRPVSPKLLAAASAAIKTSPSRTPSPRYSPYQTPTPLPNPPRVEQRSSTTPLSYSELPAENVPVFTIPNDFLTPELAHLLAVANPSIALDVYHGNGVAERIPPSSSKIDNNYARNILFSSPNGGMAQLSLPGQPDKTMGLSSGVPTSHDVTMESEVVDTRRPIHSPVANPNAHSCTPSIVPCPGNTHVPDFEFADPLQTSDSNAFLHGQVYVNPANPFSTSDNGRAPLDVWPTVAEVDQSILRAVVMSPTHYVEFGAKHIPHAYQRAHWYTLRDAILQYDTFSGLYVDAARRVDLSLRAAKYAGIPEAVASYANEHRVAPETFNGRTPPPVTTVTTPAFPPSIPVKVPPKTLTPIPRTGPRGPTPEPSTTFASRAAAAAPLAPPKPKPPVLTASRNAPPIPVTTKKPPTAPRAMRNSSPPPVIPYCRRCAHLNLPPLGHYASDCKHTTCRICGKSAPGHYVYTCPEHVCSNCMKKGTGHKSTSCPDLLKLQEEAKRLKRHQAMAELMDGHEDQGDDGYPDNMSVESRG